MNAIRKLILLAGASLVALAVLAGPAIADVGDNLVLAAEETEQAPAEEVPAGEVPAAEDEDARLTLADGPRDVFALLLLGAMIVGGAIAWRNMRRQVSGERPQASGEFRWR